MPWRAYLPEGLAGDKAPVAGWHKIFESTLQNVRLELVTLKGSGHFVSYYDLILKVKVQFRCQLTDLFRVYNYLLTSLIERMT